MADDDETAATSPAPLDTEVPSDLPADRFVVGAELGRGGMGRVVSARDRSLDRTVAIKQALGGSPTDLARFAREARLTARLEHPSIVPIHEVGHDAQGRPYYVMRKIEGEPLSDQIAQREVRDRLALIPNVLAAVEAAAFAHARGVIHRDIKPLNILVGAYGETLLIDWGLARELDGAADDPSAATSEPGPALTVAGHAFGTPGYMAPEQARGEVVDARADVYQLGATLFHVLAGVAPFDGIARSEWLPRAITGTPPPLDRIGPEVPVELVAIVDKATRADPAERYRDAGELAVDLRRFLAGQLVAAHRYTPAQRIARFVRRHRIAVAVTATAVVAASVLAVLAIDRIVTERDRANAGQASAAEAAERLLLDRASTLSDTDPTRAVALLAQLPITSPSWPRARDIAAAASSLGIRRGAYTPHGFITMLKISPDGHHLASGGRDRTLEVHDLDTAAVRSFPLPIDNLMFGVWFDDHTIAVADHTRILMVDTANGAIRQLDGDARIENMWRSGATHLRYIDARRRQLVERDVTGGAATIVAEDIQRGQGVEDVAVVEGGAGLRLIVGTRDRLLRAHGPLVGVDFAISHDRSRVAALIDGAAVEFAVEDGVQTHAIPLARTNQLFYANRDLVALEYDPFAKLVDLTGDERFDSLPRDWSIVWHTATRGGTAMAFDDGTVIVTNLAGTHVLPNHHPGTRVIAGNPDSPYLAIGSIDGSVSWWDLRDVVPTPHQLGGGITLCGYDADNLYYLDKMHVVTRTNLTTDALTQYPTDPIAICSGMIGGHVFAATPPIGVTDVDTKTGAVRRALGAFLDPRSGSATYLTDDRHTLLQLTVDDRMPRERFHTTHAIDNYAAAGPWIAVGFGGGEILRVGADGELVAPWLPAASLLAVTQEGAIWANVDRAVWRWRDGVAAPIANLSAPIRDAIPIGEDLLVELASGEISLVRQHDMVNRYEVGHHQLIFGEEMTLIYDPVGITLLYPESGMKVRRRIPLVRSAAVGPHDHGIAIATNRFTSGDVVVIYDDPVPHDPVGFHVWLRSATNAWLDPATDTLSWR